MRNSLPILAAAAVLAVISGCSESSDPISVQPIGSALNHAQAGGDFTTTWGEPLVVDLLSGRQHVVGSVSVINDETLLYVTLTLTEPWVLGQSKLAVSSSLENFPRPNRPRHNDLVFRTWHQGEREFTYEIPLDQAWYLGNEDLFIAVGLVIHRLGFGGRPVTARFAWADGERFPRMGWRTYFVYTVQSFGSGSDCSLEVTFPTPGTMLCLNQYAEITWIAEGEECGANVAIELLHEGTACLTIESEAPNMGAYAWYEVVGCGPDLDGYAIRITDVETGAVAVSAGTFTIAECPEE